MVRKTALCLCCRDCSLSNDLMQSTIIDEELPTLYFEFNWKNTLFAKRVRTNMGRATAKKTPRHTMGIMCDIDK